MAFKIAMLSFYGYLFTSSSIFLEETKLIFLAWQRSSTFCWTLRFEIQHKHSK